MRAFAAGRPLRAHLKSLLRKKEIVGDLCDQLRAGRARHLNDRHSHLDLNGRSDRCGARAGPAQCERHVLTTRRSGLDGATDEVPLPHLCAARTWPVTVKQSK